MLSRLFVSGDSRSRTGSRVRAPSGASPVSCTGSRLLTNDQQRQDMNPNEPGISQTAIGSELRAAELKIKNAICNFIIFHRRKARRDVAQTSSATCRRSCHTLPCYATHRNRNILDFMRWPHIGLGAQDLNDIQRPKSFQKIAGSQVLDEYYNIYLRN